MMTETRRRLAPSDIAARRKIRGRYLLSTSAESVSLADASGHVVYLSERVDGMRRSWIIEHDGYLVVEGADADFELLYLGMYTRGDIRRVD